MCSFGRSEQEAEAPSQAILLFPFKITDSYRLSRMLFLLLVLLLASFYQW